MVIVMKALITGASSGIGKDIARILSGMGYDLIIVARRQHTLEEFQEDLPTTIALITMDISSTSNCMQLYNKVKGDNIDILVNDAGFGLFGSFSETSLDKELDMIDLNIKSVHVLTKLFLNDFKKRNSGYILNVASSAAFMPGPLMSTYYASKAYVLHLTEAIYEELRRENSNVYVGCLCPGPVATEFNDVANVTFSIKQLRSYDVAKYAVDSMFKRKLIIVPGMFMKLTAVFGRFLSCKTMLKITYNIQKKKGK